MHVAGAEAMQRGSLMLPSESGFAPAEIPGLRKAAILMVALGDELAKTLFQSLSETDIQRGTDEITRLGEIPAAELTQVRTEFYGLLETQQYMVRGGPEYALKLLTEAFGLNRAEELLAQGRKIRERTTGEMAGVKRREPQRLGRLLQTGYRHTAGHGVA